MAEEIIVLYVKAIFLFIETMMDLDIIDWYRTLFIKPIIINFLKCDNLY